MIPRRIHKIWIGDKPIPEEYKLWHRKLVWMNPGWEITLWTDESLKKIGADLSGAYSKYWSHASVSNSLRLDLVYRFGGFYLDMDFEPLKPLDNLAKTDYNAIACPQKDGRLCNAFFASKQQSDWVLWQCDRGALSCDPHDAAWGVYTMSVAPQNGKVQILPTEAVYPFNYDDPPEKRIGPFPNSYLIHHWSKNW